MNNTVLFLDIDGVLNCGDDVEPAMGGSDTVFWPQITKADGAGKERTIYFFNRERVKLLGDFINSTNIDIVISSSWRCFYSIEELCEIFELLGIKKPIGTTPRYGEISIRGEQIRTWLNKNPHVTKYAIIDDDRDMLEEQKPYFVKTTWKQGLQLAHIEQLKSILLT